MQSDNKKMLNRLVSRAKATLLVTFPVALN